jgi:hemerythrin-like domain-containing protein
MLTASEVLRIEHQAIRDALEVLEELCFLLRAEQDIITEDVVALTDYLSRFTHDVHQKKEELLLFPALEKAGISRDEGHFAILIAGHELGAVYIRHLLEAGKHSYLNRDEFIEAAESYIRMEEAHIEQEETEILPLAEQRLTEAAQLQLAADFEQFDRLVIGQDKIDDASHVLEYFHLKYMENTD